MRSKTAGSAPSHVGVVIPLLVASALALGAAAILPLGYATTPRKDLLAQGTETTGDPAERRDRAKVQLTAEMARREGTPPTLADAVRFFGLEDATLDCAARATASNGEEEEELPKARVQAVLRQPRKVGEFVVLCLD